MRNVCVRFVIAAMSLSASTAIAENTADPDEFKRIESQASSLYLQKQYASALPLLEQAFRLRQLPNLLYNIAQTHYQLGHCAEAAESYDRFLRTAPDLSVDKAEDVKRRRQASLELCQPLKPATAQAAAGTTDPGARAPDARPAPAESPEPARRTTPPALTAPPTPPGAAAAAPEKTHRPSGWTWFGVALTGATLTGGTVAGALSLSDASRVRSAMYGSSTDYVADRDRTRGLAIAADVMLVTSAVALTTTLVATLVARRMAARGPAQAPVSRDAPAVLGVAF